MAVYLFSRFYWAIAAGVFLALEFLSPSDQIKVFRFILKIPFLADNPRLLRWAGISGEFLIGTTVAFLCFVSLRCLGKKVALSPFWAALIVILGVVSFLQPFLARVNAVWVTEALRMVLMVVALWSVYKLDWVIAFSIWAVAYVAFLAPLLFMDTIPVLRDVGGLAHTSVLTEIKSLHSSLGWTSERLAASRKLQRDIQSLQVASEKGDEHRQYELALVYLEEGATAKEDPTNSLEQACRWMTKAAGKGLAPAQNSLGDFYLEGKGIPVNPVRAAQLYREAADQGNMDAEANLGWLYAHGLGVAWQGPEALKRYTNALRGESAFALLGLADMYMTGNGVDQNRGLGMTYYIKAAEKGCAPAMVRLGVLLLAAADTPAALEQAIAYIHEAARAKVAQAQYLYMMIYTEGIGVTPSTETVRWWGNRLASSARAGYADAQWYWGCALENGLVGHADPVHALSWITQSAYKGFPEALDAQGDYFAYGLAGARDPAGALVSYQTAAQFNPKAMWNLIIRYHQGDGVPVDPAKMKYYLEQLRLSASHGDAEADYYLGDLYRNGLLLSGNSQEALSRFQRAAEGGEGKAFYRMAEMYESGEGVPRDERAAFQHYRHSAQLFYLPAFYNVAVGLLAGAGTPRNPREAAEWFLRIQRGAARGVPAHQLSLARCYERGLFVPRDEAKAVSTYQSAALRGDVDAERVLAGMIRDGRGVPKNIPLAIGWLDRAARRGDVRARRLKEALLRTLPTRLRAQAVSQALTFHPEDASQK